ncbi:PASTA domain-containing protein [Tessaracoccus sp.]
MAVVPDVRYKSVEDATKELEAVGLVVDVQYSTDFPLSLKIAAGTEPPSGSSVPVGSTVVLLVV